jgi:phosphopentomutase
MPDASLYGDVGSNTLSNTSRAVGGLNMPNMQAMGLGNITDILGVPPTAAPTASWGKNSEESAGKDTTTGHWEMMGLHLTKPFPTYPEGFPPDVMEVFEQRTGLGWLGNYAASGTEIIQDLGDEHVATGKPIVYTSADSVFQIAAHEGVMPIDELYRICGIARDEVMVGDHLVGRIIARPFVGPDSDGKYTRTHRRRDFAVKPPEPTVLDRLAEIGVLSHGIGKIGEIFAWQGICESPHVTDNMDGFTKLVERVGAYAPGFVFANLVDFDMLWGHRNDAAGYARGLEAVDARMPELLDAMVEGDLLVITADHGCDPTTTSSDHSREYTPLIAKVKGIESGVDLGTRSTFSDIGETVLDFYGIAGRCGRGESFLAHVRAS